MSSDQPMDFGVLLNLAFGAFKSRLHAHLAAKGFDDLGPSFGYVFRILADGPSSLREIAEHLDMSAPGALKIIDDMVAKNYVLRTADAQDGRIKRLTLTARANKAMVLAAAFHSEFEREVCMRVGERRGAAARAVLEDIVAFAQKGDAVRLRPL